ncbi:SH3 domain-containing protein [Flindersiella endophytica]
MSGGRGKAAHNRSAARQTAGPPAPKATTRKPQAGGLLGLQTTAGNAAVAGLVSLQRDATNQTITPDYARDLSDSELDRELSMLELSPAALPGGSVMTPSLDSNRRVLRGEKNRRRPDAGTVPPGGDNVGKPGATSADQPELHLRTAPDTNDEQNVIRRLPFDTKVQVLKKFPGNWYFVSTRSGEMGYAGSDHVRTGAPEPGAKLHKVEPGIPGTAIAIAEQYYKDKADDWGQDLRFYVNVLAFVNKMPVPDTADGWKQVHFQAGQTIWIPSQPFARSLKGKVNSGSISHNVAEAMGIADVLDRVGELMADYQMAIDKSGKYMGEAIKRHVEDTLWGVLEGLAQMLAIAAGILAVTTAIGAAIGALAGGVTAAPGAAAGFEVGMALLEWLGLAMLVYWVGESLVALGSAFGTFLGIVWNARGDEAKIDQAARQYAEAVGLLMGKLLEALFMYVTAKGLPAALKSFRGSRLGQAMGESRTVQWLKARQQAVATGQSKLKGPGAVFGGGRAASGAEGVPANVNRVGNTNAFHQLPADRLPANLPEGHFWSRSSAGEWVILREPNAPAAALELAVYSDGTTVNYVIRNNGRTIAADALTRQGGTHQGGTRLPEDLEGVGANNPYREPGTNTTWDKSHGVDFADTLEGPGVRNSTTDPMNFTPGAAWWNRGPRNILVQQIRAVGGGYREMPIYDATPRVTANGTPIPREYIFVETNRAGVPQRAWRIPNDASMTNRSLNALNGLDIPLNQVPQAMLRADAPLASDASGVTYLPGIIVGRRGDDEGAR